MKFKYRRQKHQTFTTAVLFKKKKKCYSKTSKAAAFISI